MKSYKELSNNLKKIIAGLKQKKIRDSENLFIVEGYKLTKELYESSYKTEFVVIKSNADNETIKLANQFENLGISVYIARASQFDNLCDTKTPQSIISVARKIEFNGKIKTPFIALDGISDPGNLGTIIRTADWFGIKDIVLTNNPVDKFNPKVVRASMGSLFRVNLINIDNFVDFMINNSDIEYFGASLDAKESLQSIDFNNNFCLIFGSESQGISKNILKKLTKSFKIIGYGGAESLNVSISVGISLYHINNIINK